MPPRDFERTPFACLEEQAQSWLPDAENLTRRRLLTAIPALTLIAGGVSCGDDDDEGGDATPTSNSPAAPAPPVARSIDHAFGSTEISGTPQRVVTVGWIEQDALLALGIVPIATTQWIGDDPGAIHPWATDELGQADLPVVLADDDGIDFETIASLEPDLILALYVPLGFSKEEYDRLSAIAPTVAPPAGVPDGGITWQELTRSVGLAVGNPERAEELVAEVEARFAAARADNPAFAGATALNAYPAEGGTFQAYPAPDPGGQLLEGLGFVVPKPIADLAAGAAWVDISGEQLNLFDIELLLWLVDNYAMRDALLANPLYTQLNVAKEGRHVFFGYEEDGAVAAAISIQTVLSLPFLLDNLVPKLAAAIDGDPATTGA